MDRPDVVANLAGVRHHEMDRAIQILGVHHAWLGFVDSGLPEGDPLPPLPEGCFALEPMEIAAEPLVRIVRTFRPHVMTTYDENGGYPHPDHIMCHRIAMEAYEAAGDPERYPGTGEPWKPQKLYYHMTFHKRRFQALHDVMVEAGVPGAPHGGAGEGGGGGGHPVGPPHAGAPWGPLPRPRPGRAPPPRPGGPPPVLVFFPPPP